MRAIDGCGFGCLLFKCENVRTYVGGQALSKTALVLLLAGRSVLEKWKISEKIQKRKRKKFKTLDAQNSFNMTRIAKHALFQHD